MIFQADSSTIFSLRHGIRNHLDAQKKQENGKKKNGTAPTTG